MSLLKRFIASRLAQAITGAFSVTYRAVMFASYRLRIDPVFRRVLRSRDPAVFLSWHQDFANTFALLSRTHPRRRTHVLASASRDGGLAAAAAEAVGFAPSVRGSSARGGGSALLRLCRLATGRRPVSLAIICDGPRPPARVLKPGAVALAGETGLPVYLLRTSWWPDASLRRPWARFHVPRPFHRGVAVAEGPICVPPGLDRDGVEAARLEIEARLNALADRADALAARLFGRGR